MKKARWIFTSGMSPRSSELAYVLAETIASNLEKGTGFGAWDGIRFFEDDDDREDKRQESHEEEGPEFTGVAAVRVRHCDDTMIELLEQENHPHRTLFCIDDPRQIQADFIAGGEGDKAGAIIEAGARASLAWQGIPGTTVVSRQQWEEGSLACLASLLDQWILPSDKSKVSQLVGKIEKRLGGGGAAWQDSLSQSEIRSLESKWGGWMVNAGMTLSVSELEKRSNELSFKWLQQMAAEMALENSLRRAGEEEVRSYTVEMIDKTEILEIERFSFLEEIETKSKEIKGLRDYIDSNKESVDYLSSEIERQVKETERVESERLRILQRPHVYLGKVTKMVGRIIRGKGA